MFSPSILATAMVMLKVTSQMAGMITLGRGLQNEITAYASVGVEDPKTARRRIWVGGTSIDGALMLDWAKAFLVTALVTAFLRPPI